MTARSTSIIQAVLATDSGAEEPMPTGVVLVLAPILILGGLLVAWVGYKAWRGSLSRNWAVGIRTPLTLSSDTAWDAAHRVAGPWLIVASLGSIVPGVASLFRPPNRIAPIIIMVGMAVMVTLVMVAGFLGQQAARVAVDAASDSTDDVGS